MSRTFATPTAFGKKPNMGWSFGESPAKEHTDPAWHGKLIHTELTVGAFVIMGSDAPPPHYARPQGVSVSLSVPKEADAKRIFEALVQGGAVTMPFSKTFWSPGFGMGADRFGIPWIVNTDPQ